MSGKRINSIYADIEKEPGEKPGFFAFKSPCKRFKRGIERL